MVMLNLLKPPEKVKYTTRIGRFLHPYFEPLIECCQFECCQFAEESLVLLLIAFLVVIARPYGRKTAGRRGFVIVPSDSLLPV